MIIKVQRLLDTYSRMLSLGGLVLLGGVLALDSRWITSPVSTTLLMLSIFAFPQLLGILLYFRLRRAPRWLAAIVAALAPGVVFLWLSPIFLFAGLREAYATGEVRCGMPALGALMMLFAGTTFQLLLSVTTQVALWARTSNTAVSTQPRSVARTAGNFS